MSRIIERIQKLLRLAGNAGSEAEAALAAERAAALMAEHEIHEAELAVTADAPRVVEPIEKCFEVTTTQKKVAWHMRVTSAVAESYGAQAYWSGGRVVLFGRLSAVQAAKYTAMYLMREVERLTDREAPSSNYSKAYRNAFRLGCSNRVATRLDIEARKRARAQATPSVPDAPIATADAAEFETPSVPATPEVNSMALAVIEKDREEVKTAYEDYSKNWRSGRAIGKVSSGSGYSAGRAAGDRVNLGGGGKGLPRGQGSLS